MNKLKIMLHLAHFNVHVFSFQIELQPIENVYPNLGKVSSVPVHECDIDEIECRFDDLNEAQRLVSVYITNGGVLDGEMKEFRSKVSKILRTFRSAISSLEQEKVRQCLEVYEKALSKEDYEGKFAAHWRELLKKKVRHKLSLSKTDVHVKT